MNDASARSIASGTVHFHRVASFMATASVGFGMRTRTVLRCSSGMFAPERDFFSAAMVARASARSERAGDVHVARVDGAGRLGHLAKPVVVRQFELVRGGLARAPAFAAPAGLSPVAAVRTIHALHTNRAGAQRKGPDRVFRVAGLRQGDDK